MKIFYAKVKLLLLLSLLLSVLGAFGQAEDNIWVFGRKCALDFNSGTPEFVTGYEINAFEGCASFSDPTGNIMFYANVDKIWNKMHEPMMGSSGMEGEFLGSSTQGVVISKYPGTDSLYYVFTIEPCVAEPALLRYHIVDMSLDGGLGGVLEAKKNIVLDSFVSEKMTLTKDDYCGYWLIAFSHEDYSYRSYHITDTGIAAPVISVSTVLAGSEDVCAHGELKVSPNGAQIANARTDISGFELASFNKATGVVSNTVHVSSDYMFAGCEFSPNSKLVYGVSSRIIQYDLSGFPSASTIESSAFDLGLWETNYLSRRASNGKIYLTHMFGASITVINNPNSLGTLCDVASEAILIPTGHTARSSLGTSTLVNLHGQTGKTLDVPFCPDDGSIVLEGAEGSTYYEWSNGVVDRSTTVDTAGIYWLKRSDGCIVIVDTYRVTETDCGLSVHPDVDVTSEVRLYPNPLEGDYISIERKTAKRAPVLIFDCIGKEVYKGYITGERSSIKIADLPPGIYIVQIGNVRKKLVVK